jgi:hypothetical protein
MVLLQEMMALNGCVAGDATSTTDHQYRIDRNDLTPHDTVFVDQGG